MNEKRSLIPWGLRLPLWKMNFCSRVLRLSVLRWCRERPQTAICCLEWLGRLKRLATGLDALLSFCLSLRHEGVILTERLGPDIFSTLRMKGHDLHRARACAFKSSESNARSTQKSYVCFCRVNESSELAKWFWQYRDHLKVFRMMDFTAWHWRWNVKFPLILRKNQSHHYKTGKQWASKSREPPRTNIRANLSQIWTILFVIFQTFFEIRGNNGPLDICWLHTRS